MGIFDNGRQIRDNMRAAEDRQFAIQNERIRWFELLSGDGESFRQGLDAFLNAIGGEPVVLSQFIQNTLSAIEGLPDYAKSGTFIKELQNWQKSIGWGGIVNFVVKNGQECMAVHVRRTAVGPEKFDAIVRFLKNRNQISISLDIGDLNLVDLNQILDAVGFRETKSRELI